MDITPETRIVDLTIGQLMDYLAQNGAIVNAPTQQPSTPKRMVYGMLGIAQLFGCSKSTANRIKQSGIIAQAITQRGRTIMVDADLALQLYNNNH